MAYSNVNKKIKFLKLCSFKKIFIKFDYFSKIISHSIYIIFFKWPPFIKDLRDFAVQQVQLRFCPQESEKNFGKIHPSIWFQSQPHT